MKTIEDLLSRIFYDRWPNIRDNQEIDISTRIAAEQALVLLRATLGLPIPSDDFGSIYLIWTLPDIGIVVTLSFSADCLESCSWSVTFEPEWEIVAGQSIDELYVLVRELVAGEVLN